MHGLLTNPKERAFYYWYFVVHIPITIFIDSSVVLGDRPPVWSSLVMWHCQNNNDFLLLERPMWLWWFVLIELILQLPLFFYFVFNWSCLNSPLVGKKTYRLLTLLRFYGLEAALTTAVCIWAIWQRGNITLENQLQLTFVYLPTLIIPGRLCFF